MPSRKSPYRLTTLSCFVGIFIQAIITNLSAILFVPLMKLYKLDFVQLGILVGINFVAQVVADIAFSGFIDKIGFRKITVSTCIMAVVGLVFFAFSPVIFPKNVFGGFLIATLIFAMASGLLEIVLSPIIDAIPSDNKGAAMSLMHSFYAWGQVGTVVITTLFLFIFGSNHWQIIIFIWALVPLTAFFMFSRCKMPPQSGEETRKTAKSLMKSPFYILALLAILFGGASEVIMGQWTSSFLDSALGIPKITGDLLGMCGFAVMLGLGRVFYGIYGAKINMYTVLLCGSGAAFVLYIIAALSPLNYINIAACALTGFVVSLLWPGVIVISSERFPASGVWMFAILAAAGDIGAAAGPYITGLVTDTAKKWALFGWFRQLYQASADSAAMRIGILISALFPLITFFIHLTMRKIKLKAEAPV